MLGYWRRPEMTAAVLDGNMLRTGDIGSIDQDGWVSVTGRLSHVIIRGGANVMPVEVESVLTFHDAVDSAAVFGIDDDRLGELVVAYVVTSRSVDTAELVRHCEASLAKYKVPDTILFIEALPRNAMGKVDLRTLRELAATSAPRWR
jgi:acyl-CoA synthetase (AMP-forming)/AMP-acid ligase II